MHLLASSWGGGGYRLMANGATAEWGAWFQVPDQHAPFTLSATVTLLSPPRRGRSQPVVSPVVCVPPCFAWPVEKDAKGQGKWNRNIHEAESAFIMELLYERRAHSHEVFGITGRGLPFRRDVRTQGFLLRQNMAQFRYAQPGVNARPCLSSASPFQQPGHGQRRPSELSQASLPCQANRRADIHSDWALPPPKNCFVTT